MIQYIAEIGLSMLVLFLLGCLMGALAYRRRNRPPPASP
jgi:cbb3-type cytochrome oxidase subunit 3